MMVNTSVGTAVARVLQQGGLEISIRGFFFFFRGRKDWKRKKKKKKKGNILGMDGGVRYTVLSWLRPPPPPPPPFALDAEAAGDVVEDT